MGCDIHSYAEAKNEKGKWVLIPQVKPFDWRNYTTFSFLAGVRNGMGIKPIHPRRGMPDDASAEVLHENEGWMGDAHSHSWLTTEELVDFNYDALVDYLAEPDDLRGRLSRVLRESAGLEEEPREVMTYRQLLSEEFFDELEELQKQGVGRVVFWFDN